MCFSFRTTLRRAVLASVLCISFLGPLSPANALIQCQIGAATTAMNGTAVPTTQPILGSTPPFFSGTNCRVTAQATILPCTCVPPPTVADQGLTISGTVKGAPESTTLRSLFAAPGGAITLTFDSSHFDPNTSITVTMFATDTEGFRSTARVSAIGINNTYVLGNDNNQDLFEGYTAAHDIGPVFFNANRSETTSTDTYKLSTYDYLNGNPGILDNIPDYSEFYIYTHGNTDVFGDCYALGSSDDTYYLFGTSGSDPLSDPTVRDKVNSKSAAPPYNFVYVDACYSSADNTLAEAFLPYTNLAVDRAFLGWTTSVEDDIQNVNFSQQVVQDLSDGMTLKDAVADANTKDPPFYIDNSGRRVTAVTGTFGDENMKLRGYYGGTGTDWYLIQP